MEHILKIVCYIVNRTVTMMLAGKGALEVHMKLKQPTNACPQKSTKPAILVEAGDATHPSKLSKL
jgi:uncharacterized membrane protein